jgi:hypothetical protein
MGHERLSLSERGQVEIQGDHTGGAADEDAALERFVGGAVEAAVG